MERRKNTLNEKIPSELAAAMKRTKNFGVSAGINTRYPQYDFENANYEEITADEARALRKQGRADEVLVLTRYGIARFYYDGTVKESTTEERNTFKSNIESPDLIKIYHTDEKQHKLDHRARQLDQKRNQLISYKSDGSSYSYDTDTIYGEEGQKMTRVIGDTGSHKKDSKIKDLSRWVELAENDVDDFKERIESLNKDLEDLAKKFDDGDLSRNEFTRQQQKLLDQLDTIINDRLPQAQKMLAKYKKNLADRKSAISTSRYTAQANLMSAPLKRLKYIKDNTAEKDILNEEEADTEDLEYISATISERDYYQNTNK